MHINFFIALRTNSYNRVPMQCPDSKHIISSEYCVLPKGDLFTLKNEHLLERVHNGKLNQCDYRKISTAQKIFQFSDISFNF